jgi:hypothetical protein
MRVMRRPWWTRLAAAVLGIWLVLVVGEPGIVHVCPTHDGAAIRAGAADHGMASHASHASHTGASAAGSRHAAAQDQGPAHDHQSCTCVGCCVGVSVAALLDRAPTTAFAVALIPATRDRTPVGLLPRPGPRHSRPYPTGPPRA